MTDKEPETAIEKLAALRNAYTAGLDGKLSDLEVLADSLIAASARENANELVEKLGAKSHHISGSAGTFGYSHIGTAAKNLELFCQALVAKQAPFSDSDYQQIAALMALLRQSREQPQGSACGDAVPENRISKSQDPESTDVQNILLVEDDPEQSSRLMVGIGAFGYAIKVIKNVEEIEAGIATHNPAAIVLDLQFNQGRTTSAETIRKIRAVSGIGCPIIVLSVHTDFEARLTAVRASSDHFLAKPVTLDDIVQLLDSLITPTAAQPQRVMIIDDDPDIRDYVQTSLQVAGMIVETLGNPTRTLEKIEEFRPELLLVDLQMPECNGKELAAIIRQKPEYSTIPIVFLSGEKNTEVQFDAMSVGADDFLTKPIDTRYLAPAVRLRVDRFRDLRDMMARDSLTGLYNHATTKQLLETELYRASRANTPVAFAMLDIDHFKAVNDSYGHLTGDAVIKLLSGILTHRLRQGDVIGRLGGEEFGVILPDTTIDQAHTAMEAVRTGFEEISQNVAGSDKPITVSCGVAVFPQYGSVNELSQAADLALYDAKNGGRNTTVLAKASDTQQSTSAIAR